VVLEVSAEAYGSAIVRPLTDALDAELLARYPRFRGSGDEPDAAAFAWLVRIDNAAVGEPARRSVSPSISRTSAGVAGGSARFARLREPGRQST
jgi:hypothetical protein